MPINDNEMSKPARTHKAQVSHSVDSFLRNLRLLNLDEEFDWPSISFDTFAANDSIQNQKRRISNAEWVLYKLFEIYCPKETTKVRFPETNVNDTVKRRHMLKPVAEAGSTFSCLRTNTVPKSTCCLISSTYRA